MKKKIRYNQFDSINISQKEMDLYFQETDQNNSEESIVQSLKVLNDTSKWEFTLQKIKDLQKDQS